MTTTKWTKHDERGQAYEVAYLCNGQAPCAGRLARESSIPGKSFPPKAEIAPTTPQDLAGRPRRMGCGLSGPKYRDCYRTCDPKYALNGTCADPANHPERFEAISRSRAPVLYAEIRP